MNNGTKIGLNNFKYSTDGVNYHPVESVKDITLNTESVDKIYCDFGNDINKSSTFSFKIHKKRKGTVLERWLYYHNHKKKRIRKKYRLDKLLIRGNKYGIMD